MNIWQGNLRILRVLAVLKGGERRQSGPNQQRWGKEIATGVQIAIKQPDITNLTLS